MNKLFATVLTIIVVLTMTFDANAQSTSLPADLAITILDATDGTYAPGDDLDVEAKIENIGETGSDPYILQFYASSDRTITMEDIPVWWFEMESLGVGEDHWRNFATELPADIANGEYYIGAIVEDFDELKIYEDSNISNNTRYDATPITVASVSVKVSNGHSGSWHNSDQDGHGLNVQALDETRTLIYWYVYHTDGTPMFLITVGTNDGNSTTGITYYNTGMIFGEFNPDDREQTVWGMSTVTFHDCNNLTLEYSSDDPTYGSGTIPMERLTFISGLPCSDSQ
jgi:hypothetical protein